jgi:7,8-dihydro-6-hydroxymethylpterin dimethyltransferase
METLGITHSVCGVCRTVTPAKLVVKDGGVYIRRLCAEHGESESLVHSDAGSYISALRYVKPAWVPRAFAGNSNLPCPDGCGFCDRHEQHLCMPIVEITSRCDLDCPICLVDAGQSRDMTLEEFERILNRLVEAEQQIDVLNISGGEPLRHPRFLDFVDSAMNRNEIVRVSISTNGLSLLENDSMLSRLADRGVIISLQFDGFDDSAYRVLRGKPLLDQKLRILDKLAERNISTSLTMTAAGGINNDQFGAILKLFFSSDHIISLMVQPLAFSGRASSFAGRASRLTIPDIIRQLAASGHPAVEAADFIPLPCSHPLCFSLAFYIADQAASFASVNRLFQLDRYLDSLSNRIIFGLDIEEQERLKEMVYDLWSGPAGNAPDGAGVLKTIRALLQELPCGCFNPRQSFSLMERRIKSIFIHAFQDCETFDLARIRRCCNAYPQPDGRLMPACAHNILKRQQQ